MSPPDLLVPYDLVPQTNDMRRLSLEIEKERVEYLEKSKHLQDQLRDLRTEIEVLKVGEKQSELDLLHEEQVRLGENKYSTLRKVRRERTKFWATGRDFPLYIFFLQYARVHRHSRFNTREYRETV
ncbi:merlin-like [Diaphorina citri]|uniref:Merlin-like n=1 Tax=Diaphorina citri TaxID=121845 RepID=A0A3Q0IYQ0_DIACI|nr:merlin-like [Diaphorina citri]